ncbi:MAG: ROK family protein [Nitrospirota bacterium]|nr:ROK family protein [Nitrospirota bacterium]
MADVAIGVDVGGSAVRAVAVDRDSQIQGDTVYFPLQTRGRDEVLDCIVRAVRQAGEGHNVAAVGVGVPAFLRHERGVIEMSPNLPELTGWEIGKALREVIPQPLVLENDANAAAFGEALSGVWEGCDPFIYIAIGTGIGGGIVLNGQLLRGATGLAGEIGHLTVQPKGLKCGCGAEGCLETYASATGIVNAFLTATQDMPESDFVAKYGARNEVTALQLSELAGDGDTAAFQAFAQAGRALGVAIAQLCRIFDPAAIAFGGQVSGSWDLFWPTMWEEMVELIPVRLRENLMIQPATFAASAGAVGAAGLAWRSVQTA